MGSFLNCAAYRIARKEDFMHGKSHCTSCGHDLSARDLIPVLSYISSRGRCRYCGQKVSIRYPISELICGLLYLGCFLNDGTTVLALRDIIFVSCLFCISIVDMEIREIPDGGLAIAAAAWLATAYFVYDCIGQAALNVASGLVFGAAMLFISLAMDKILKKESLGGGDIKFFAVVGLYLGFIPTLFCIMIACITGLLGAVVLRKKSIAFGPFIAVGTYFMLLWGQRITDWYLGLF
ncbi:MAG: prepilin peptidase [Lachnospiraceae bacterium]|nr:prepilin peptidase [Lachnospiraceae bacterium]